MDKKRIPPKPPDIEIEPSQYSLACSDIIIPQAQHSISGEQIDISDNATRKRPAVTDLPPKDIPSKFPRSVPSDPIGRRRYSALDKAPYVVHISRVENEQNSGTTMHHVKFGLFLLKHNISNVLQDGIKRLGRNRVSVAFKSPEDANAFLSNSILEQNKYVATVPQFNVTRMGLVRGVPSEWTDEEVMTYVKVPAGCGRVLKVRRLNRKSVSDKGKTEWVPGQTVVLTFDGQVLPKRVFCCYSALEVEMYTYPTIQCYNCCRFGHTRNLCRSKPRCYKCGLDHPGDGCSLDTSQAICINCDGDHPANNKDCPEYGRQRAVKLLMAEQSISYSEADKKIPAVSRKYAEVTKTLPAQPSRSCLSPPHSFTQSPSGQRRTYSQALEPPKSHKKTVFLKHRTHSPLPSGYDRHAHHALINNYSYSPSQNGCAFNQGQQKDNDRLTNDPLEQIVNIIVSLISSKTLPDHVAHKLNSLMYALHNGPSPYHSAVECEESQ